MEELELTYLTGELPSDFQNAPYDEMLDIYIPLASTHPILRIRKRGTTYEITKKQPIEEGDASRQLETTIPLTVEEYTALSSLQGKRVHKMRYYYSYEGRCYEIDVFQDDLNGLGLVDVEFSTQEEKEAFQPPPFCLVDVTQEDCIAGGMVCGKTYADIEERLAQLRANALL